MELREAERVAKELMSEFGVGHLAFAFDNSKVRLGAMHSKRIADVVIPNKITISRHYVPLLPEEEVRDTILHEIAHALTPGKGHGPAWRATARGIGANPKTCASPSASPEESVTGTCEPCGKVVIKGHRLPQVFRYHRGCDVPLTYRRNGAKVSTEQMPTKYRRHLEFAKSKGFI